MPYRGKVETLQGGRVTNRRRVDLDSGLFSFGPVGFLRKTITVPDTKDRQVRLSLVRMPF